MNTARDTSGNRVLVHICCGPCSITVVQGLREEGFAVTGLFYNPNIHPASEYLRRREGLVQVAARLDLPVIFLDREYDPALYLRETAFREQNRCFHCYRLRLERTLKVARRGGFPLFTSTLLYSRQQKHDLIRDLGRDIAGASKTAFLYRDYRSTWKKGIELSRSFGIYRQDYCGCILSEFERRRRELKELGEDGRGGKGG
ncbi:MAG: epoxyqueuosine reductase QueH [Desulfovibrio sp.]|nr:epoxyqueuosine reductase QueH [Desulfovibrio sp.]